MNPVRHWMFNCREISRKVSESMDVQLPLHQRLSIRVHLFMCRYCARFKKQLLLLQAAGRAYEAQLDTVGPSATLSAEACDRIRASLKQGA